MPQQLQVLFAQMPIVLVLPFGKQGQFHLQFHLLELQLLGLTCSNQIQG